MRWLKHAFAVDPPGPAEPTPEQQPAIDAFCRQVAKRHLTTPGVLALEMCRPLNFLASQAMYVGQPFAWAITGRRTYEDYKHVAEFLEKRGSLEYVSQRIEHFEAEFERRKREAKRAVTARREEAPEGAADTAPGDEDFQE